VDDPPAEPLSALEAQTIGALDTVVTQLDRAVEALSYQDVELAAIVVAGDDRIDASYMSVHQGILSVLAGPPLEPGDLRLAAALLHCVRSIERTGDQCVNVAKLVALSGHEVPKDKEIVDSIERMARRARSQLLEARDAFATRNLELARDLVHQDSEINRLNRAIFKRAVEVGDQLEMREWAMFMVLAARCLERIGDQTVDLAEQVVFVVTGRFEEMSDASRPRPGAPGR
jgi:phosphate transport system protein